MTCRRAHLGSAFLLLLLLGCAAQASAQRGVPDNPYRYDLRSAIFPLSFSGGISQSSFGAGLRSELDVSRRLTLQMSGRLPFVSVAGRKDASGFGLRAGIQVHLIDAVEHSELSGVVRPEDAPAPGGRTRGTDSDLAVPTSSKLGGPRMLPPDRGKGRAPIRYVHAVRVGYELARAVERARPAADVGSRRYELNTLSMLYVGYGFGTHWNISPATVGQREVGFRRFYVDVLLTAEPFVHRRALDRQTSGGTPALFPAGVRLGMQGAIGALLRRAPGIGFGYDLELGALPGYSGVEGYVLVGLGLELDLSSRPAR